MKIIRVHKRAEDDESIGYDYYRDLGEAMRACRTLNAAGFKTERTEHEVHVTALGMIDALNYFASHPDNG